MTESSIMASDFKPGMRVQATLPDSNGPHRSLGWFTLFIAEGMRSSEKETLKVVCVHNLARTVICQTEEGDQYVYCPSWLTAMEETP